MRKCEIVKKIEIRIYVMIKKNYCVYVMLKKNVMHTGLFTGHFANGRYAISIIATYYIEIIKWFCSAWNRRTAVWEVQRKKKCQIFDQIVSVVLQWAKPKNHRAKISHKK